MAPVIPQIHARAADLTGDRFCMKAPIGFGLILGLAGGAELESGHGRMGALIGDRREQAVAWSALRTGEERIPKTTIVWIGELAPTVGAGGQVGRDDKGTWTGLDARTDGKARVIQHRNDACAHCLDTG